MERKKREFKWNNQYVSLVATKSDHIIASGEEISPEEKETLSQRLKDFSKVFVELGSGSGNHLIERAARQRDAFWVGFEIRFKRVFRTGEKAEERGVTNSLVIRNSAHKISEFFTQSSIDGVYVNFPDPWDKKRWHKNRLMRDPLLSTIIELLKPGGFIAYKTDHHGSFDELEGLLKERKDGAITEISRDLYTKPEYLVDNIQTEFEQMFINQKLPIYYLQWVKSIK